MPRLRALLAAALTVGGLAVPHAQAAPFGWVVTGSRTAYVDVKIDFATWLYPAKVTTNGRFGGVYGEQLSYRDGSRSPDRGTIGGGWVAIRGLGPDPKRLDTVLVGHHPHFEPGVVRLYLIADGPTTVEMDTNHSGERRTFRPTARTRAAARVTPLSGPASELRASVPLRLGRDDLAAAVVQVTGERSFLADVTVCVRSPGEACRPRAGDRFGSAEAGGGVGPLDPERRWQWSGRASGEAVGEATVRPYERVTRAVLATFSLALVRDRA